ncbi:agmatinase [Halodesulfovibrio spirochaetisodalis]|uniref:Agmatinase n=1 Tax=Halodesulfovibrio spirochaetisodalis TaxID=1560234 RepID=A0A1B7XAM9_9BACT|nr:agmatinase [Halodesulfovibrio spirochaetisodalis]OBQ46433.1 agmatinase [Halodesulfovibrio spirochaetisodalis]
MSKPINSLESPRFCGVRTFMRLPNVATAEGVDFAILGVPFDTATSYKPGCRFGPESIRAASSILKNYNEVLDVDIFEECTGVDCGDIDIVPGYLEESFEKIEEGVSNVIQEGAVPVIMGGDHSITLPELRAVAKKHGPVALIHFDAHSDTGNDYFGKPYNHGTTFHWAIKEGLFKPEESSQVGIRGPLYSRDGLKFARESGMDVITGWELHHIGVEAAVERIRRRITPNTPVFVTFDIDFLDAAYAPGTGTPEIGGFTTHEALKLMLESCQGLNLVGMDLVEVLPESDTADITSFAAAGIMHAFLSCLAYNKRHTGTE